MWRLWLVFHMLIVQISNLFNRVKKVKYPIIKCKCKKNFKTKSSTEYKFSKHWKTSRHYLGPISVSYMVLKLVKAKETYTFLQFSFWRSEDLFIEFFAICETVNLWMKRSLELKRPYNNCFLKIYLSLKKFQETIQ